MGGSSLSQTERAWMRTASALGLIAVVFHWAGGKCSASVASGVAVVQLCLFIASLCAWRSTVANAAAAADAGVVCKSAVPTVIVQPKAPPAARKRKPRKRKQRKKAEAAKAPPAAPRIQAKPATVALLTPADVAAAPTGSKVVKGEQPKPRLAPVAEPTIETKKKVFTAAALKALRSRASPGAARWTVMAVPEVAAVMAEPVKTEMYRDNCVALVAAVAANAAAAAAAAASAAAAAPVVVAAAPASPRKPKAVFTANSLRALNPLRPAVACGVSWMVDPYEDIVDAPAAWPRPASPPSSSCSSSSSSEDEMPQYAAQSDPLPNVLEVLLPKSVTGHADLQNKVEHDALLLLQLLQEIPGNIVRQSLIGNQFKERFPGHFQRGLIKILVMHLLDRNLVERSGPGGGNVFISLTQRATILMSQTDLTQSQTLPAVDAPAAPPPPLFAPAAFSQWAIPMPRGPAAAPSPSLPTWIRSPDGKSFTAPPTGKPMVGVVVAIQNTFGFISVEGMSEDLFFHTSSLKPGDWPTNGQHVSFYTKQNAQTGMMNAVFVRRLQHTQTPWTTQKPRSRLPQRRPLYARFGRPQPVQAHRSSPWR